MKTTIKFLLILIAMMGCNMPVTAQSNASTSSHKIVVVADTTSKRSSQQAELVGEYRKDGKSYPLYRGKRGGYFYLTGEKKDGKDVKKYLTKKEKEANNLK